MPGIYQTARHESKEESRVLVIYCSDSRYQPHFQEFLQRGLGIEQYALVAVPGGPQFLTLAEYLPKFGWAGWRWVKFMMRLDQPERVILIAHEDCQWYRHLRFGSEAAPIREKQLEDLRHVRLALLDRFGKDGVELYYSTLQDGRAAFERL